MSDILIQVKRSTVAGRTPNTTNVANSQYIADGELAINLPDGVLYSSNGSALIEIGARLSSLTTNSYARAPQLIALGGSGEGGQVILGYGNNLANSITGQANNTWNIDVFGGAGVNALFRVFTQHNDGTVTPGLMISNTGKVVFGTLTENTDSTVRVEGTANVSGSLQVNSMFVANGTAVKITSNDKLTFNDNTTQNTAFRVYNESGTRIA